MFDEKYRVFLKGVYDVLNQIIERHTGYKTLGMMCSHNGPVVYIIVRIDVEKLKSSMHYIGSSNNIAKRINGKHRVLDKSSEEQDYFNIMFIKKYIMCDNYIEVEKKLIKVFQPTENIVGKKMEV